MWNKGVKHTSQRERRIFCPCGWEGKAACSLVRPSTSWSRMLRRSAEAEAGTKPERLNIDDVFLVFDLTWNHAWSHAQSFIFGLAITFIHTVLGNEEAIQLEMMPDRKYRVPIMHAPPRSARPSSAVQVRFTVMLQELSCSTLSYPR